VQCGIEALYKWRRGCANFVHVWVSKVPKVIIVPANECIDEIWARSDLFALRLEQEKNTVGAASLARRSELNAGNEKRL
jgi:hypothetical protein